MLADDALNSVVLQGSTPPPPRAAALAPAQARLTAYRVELLHGQPCYQAHETPYKRMEPPSAHQPCAMRDIDPTRPASTACTVSSHGRFAPLRVHAHHDAVTYHAGLRGRPPKFDGRPRTASGSILSAGGGANVTAGTTRSLGDQTVAALSAGAYDSSGPLGFVPYEVRDVIRAVACIIERSALTAFRLRTACPSKWRVVMHAQHMLKVDSRDYETSLKQPVSNAQQHKQRLAAAVAHQQQRPGSADAEDGVAGIRSGLRSLGPKTRSHFADAAE